MLTKEAMTQDIQKTFLHLQSEAILHSDKVLLCLTIPLTKERFILEKGGISWWGRLFGISKDFARSFSKSYYEPYWHGDNGKGYNNRVVMPILKYLLHIREHTQATILYDCTFKQFNGLMKDNNYDWVILVAHHFGSKIEFADGGIEINQLVGSLGNTINKTRKSLYLMVCESEGAFQDLRDKIDIGAMGYSSYEIPVLQGLEFLKYWLGELDGTNTLAEAYHAAILKYIKSYQ